MARGSSSGPPAPSPWFASTPRRHRPRRGRRCSPRARLSFVADVSDSDPVDPPAADWTPSPPPESELPRRVEKPWGAELIWAWTDRYVGKILTIKAGKRLSLQYHERKDEWIHVLSGRMILTLESETGAQQTTEMGPGDSARVRTGRTHRYEATEDCEVIEVSPPELLDVVRLSDDFGREGTSAP